MGPALGYSSPTISERSSVLFHSLENISKIYVAPSGPDHLDLAQMAELFPIKDSAFRTEFLFRGNIADVWAITPALSANTRMQLNMEAQAVIEWTRGELGIAQWRFLADLPLTREVQGRWFVHAEASRPQSWKYVADTTDAARSINATSAHVTLCGHIHKPALCSLSAARKMTAFTPTSGVSVQLLPGRQWLAERLFVGK
jgi:hypothetical protein